MIKILVRGFGGIVPERDKAAEKSAQRSGRVHCITSEELIDQLSGECYILTLALVIAADVVPEAAADLLIRYAQLMRAPGSPFCQSEISGIKQDVPELGGAKIIHRDRAVAHSFIDFCLYVAAREQHLHAIRVIRVKMRHMLSDDRSVA